MRTVHRRNGRRPRNAKAQRLRQRSQRARRAHRHAMSRTARDAILNLAPLLPAQIARTFFIPVLPDIAAAAQRLATPVALDHRPAGHVDHRDVHAERPHEQPRRGFVTAAQQHRAINRIGPQHLLRLHRQKIAVKHRRRLRQHLPRRHHRNFHRMPARLQNTPLHRIRRQPQMHVAGVQITPRVQNPDHRLAYNILTPPPRLLRPRAMAKGSQFITAIPAPGAKLFRSFAGGSVFRGHR